MSATPAADEVGVQAFQFNKSGPVICMDAAIGTTGTRIRRSAGEHSMCGFPCMQNAIASEKTSQCYPIPVGGFNRGHSE